MKLKFKPRAWLQTYSEQYNIKRFYGNLKKVVEADKNSESVLLGTKWLLCYSGYWGERLDLHQGHCKKYGWLACAGGWPVGPGKVHLERHSIQV